MLLGGSLIATPLPILSGAALADRLAGAHGLGLRRTETVVVLLPMVVVGGFFVLALVAGRRLSREQYADPRVAPAGR